jgi:DNA-binding transcriptional LysR family regulator
MDERDLRDLAAFAVVAEQRSFRGAARSLGLSVSSLSQRVKELEGRLGLRLLNRTTRSVAVTEAGETLLARLKPSLADLDAALIDIKQRQGEPSGRLRINAPPPAVDLVLAPMVAPFLKAHPRIQMEIVAESRLVDIVAEGFDAGVRYEENLARDMVALSLAGPARYQLVAAPALLRERGLPKHPRDLVDQPCLVTRFASGMVLPWEFTKGGRNVKFTPQGPLVVAHIALQLRAVEDGLGFAVMFADYAAASIAAGKLVSVLEDWLPPFPGPFLYYPSRRQPPPALAAFIAFVKDRRRR